MLPCAFALTIKKLKTNPIYVIPQPSNLSDLENKSRHSTYVKIVAN
jgi:hypothetical protein